MAHELEDVHTLSGNCSSATDSQTGEVVVRSSGIPRRTATGELSHAQVASRINPHRVMREALPAVWRNVGLLQGLREGKTFASRSESPELGPTVDASGRVWYGSRILERGARFTRAPTVAELEGL
jgi:hypothetical protein